MGVVERGLVPRPVVTLANTARRWSLWAMPCGTACCAATLDGALRSPRLDAERLGAVAVADPAAANVLVVGGPTSAHDAASLRSALDASPHPRYVLAIGACAISGGPYATALGGLASGADLPVDVWVPGCPPRPEAILDGLRLLQERIAAEDPSPRWRAAGRDPAGPLLPRPPVVRGAEGVWERLTWAQLPSVAARLDECGSVARACAVCEAVETLAGLTVPDAAIWMRQVLVELATLRHATTWYAGLAERLGLSVAESVSWRARELVVDAFDSLGGSPVHADLIVLGGVRRAADPTWRTRTDGLLAPLWDWSRSMDRLVLDIGLVESRLRGLGRIEPASALELGLAGPSRRGSAPLPTSTATLPAERGPSEVPTTHPGGDAHARAFVRLQDARRACQSLRRLLARGPGSGPRLADLGPIPSGVADAVASHPEGEVLCTVAADGTERPWRVRINGPATAAAAAVAHVAGRESLTDDDRDLVSHSFAADQMAER